MTVNDMFDMWKELKRGLKDNTFSNYIYMYNTFVRDTFGYKRISELKKSDVKRFYNTLIEDRGLKPNTLDNVHTVLHQVFEMAVDDDYIRSNPSSNVIREIKQAYGIKIRTKEIIDSARTEIVSRLSLEEQCQFTLVPDLRFYARGTVSELAKSPG